MAIQHRNIPDSEIHEPKGAAGAVQGTLYVADGGGSGSFRKIGQESLLGSTGGYPAGYTFVSDGAGGFSVKAGSTVGAIAWTGNGSTLNVTDNPEVGNYTVITNRTGSPWSVQHSSNTTLVNGYYLRPNVSGLFKVKAIINVGSMSTSDSAATIRFRLTTDGSNQRSETATMNTGTSTTSGLNSGTLVLECYANLNTSSLVGLLFRNESGSSDLIINSCFLSIELVD